MEFHEAIRHLQVCQNLALILTIGLALRIFSYTSHVSILKYMYYV